MADIFVKDDLPSLVKEAKRELEEDKSEDLTEGEEDLAHKWWNSWIAGDMLEREKLIDQVIVDAIMEVVGSTELRNDTKRRMLTLLMTGFLEDLYATALIGKYNK